MVNRYADIGNDLPTASPVVYFIANPNSWTWMDTSRPLDTSDCLTYDDYRDGFTNFAGYLRRARTAARDSTIS